MQNTTLYKIYWRNQTTVLLMIALSFLVLTAGTEKEINNFGDRTISKENQRFPFREGSNFNYHLTSKEKRNGLPGNYASSEISDTIISDVSENDGDVELEDDYDEEVAAPITSNNSNGDGDKNGAIDRKDSHAAASYTINSQPHSIKPNPFKSLSFASDLEKFLSLPVRYSSSDKFPLISSSYANMKIQGSNYKPTHFLHNHKINEEVTVGVKSEIGESNVSKNDLAGLVTKVSTPAHKNLQFQSESTPTTADTGLDRIYSHDKEISSASQNNVTLKPATDQNNTNAHKNSSEYEDDEEELSYTDYDYYQNYAGATTQDISHRHKQDVFLDVTENVKNFNVTDAATSGSTTPATTITTTTTTKTVAATATTEKEPQPKNETFSDKIVKPDAITTQAHSNMKKDVDGTNMMLNVQNENGTDDYFIENLLSEVNKLNNENFSYLHSTSTATAVSNTVPKTTTTPFDTSRRHTQSAASASTTYKPNWKSDLIVTPSNEKPFAPLPDSPHAHNYASNTVPVNIVQFSGEDARVGQFPAGTIGKIGITNIKNNPLNLSGDDENDVWHAKATNKIGNTTALTNVGHKNNTPLRLPLLKLPIKPATPLAPLSPKFKPPSKIQNHFVPRPYENGNNDAADATVENINQSYALKTSFSFGITESEDRPLPKLQSMPSNINATNNVKFTNNNNKANNQLTSPWKIGNPKLTTAAVASPEFYKSPSSNNHSLPPPPSYTHIRPHQKQPTTLQTIQYGDESGDGGVEEYPGSNYYYPRPFWELNGIGGGSAVKLNPPRRVPPSQLRDSAHLVAPTPVLQRRQSTNAVYSPPNSSINKASMEHNDSPGKHLPNILPQFRPNIESSMKNNPPRQLPVTKGYDTKRAHHVQGYNYHDTGNVPLDFLHPPSLFTQPLNYVPEVEASLSSRVNRRDGNEVNIALPVPTNYYERSASTTTIIPVPNKLRVQTLQMIVADHEGNSERELQQQRSGTSSRPVLVYPAATAVESEQIAYALLHSPPTTALLDKLQVSDAVKEMPHKNSNGFENDKFKWNAEDFPLLKSKWENEKGTAAIRGHPARGIERNSFPYSLVKPDIRDNKNALASENDKSAPLPEGAVLPPTETVLDASSNPKWPEYAAFVPTTSATSIRMTEYPVGNDNIQPFIQDYMPFATKKPSSAAVAVAIKDNVNSHIAFRNENSMRQDENSYRNIINSTAGRPETHDFQAPFQASPETNNGWSAIKASVENVKTEKSTSTLLEEKAYFQSLETTTGDTVNGTLRLSGSNYGDGVAAEGPPFNFKPQLLGGFQPLISANFIHHSANETV